MNHRDISVFIFLTSGTGDKICVHQAHFIAREHTEVLSWRNFHKVFPLNIQLPSKGNLTASEGFIFQIVRHLQHLRLIFRIVVNHQLHRIQNRHHTGTLHFQVFTDTVLKHRIIHRAVRLGNSAQINQHLDGFRSKAAAAQSGDGRDSRIIPSIYHLVLHQLLDITFSRHHIGQIHFCELNLARRIFISDFSHHPVIQRTVILKLQRTQGMGNSLNRILDGMGKIVHRVDAPFISCIVMRNVSHPVKNRISHIDIRGRHIYFCAEHTAAVLEFSCAHLLEQFQVFLYAAVTVRAVLSWFRQSSAVFTDFLRAQVADIGLPFFDQLDCSLIHLLKIIRRKVQVILPVGAQPADIFLDRLHKLCLFLCRICIVKSKMKLTVVFLRHSIAQQNSLGMSDMQITVRLRRETGADMIVNTFRQVFLNGQFNKIFRYHFFFFHNNSSSSNLSPAAVQPSELLLPLLIIFHYITKKAVFKGFS